MTWQRDLVLAPPFRTASLSLTSRLSIQQLKTKSGCYIFFFSLSSLFHLFTGHSCWSEAVKTFRRPTETPNSANCVLSCVVLCSAVLCWPVGPSEKSLIIYSVDVRERDPCAHMCVCVCWWLHSANFAAAKTFQPSHLDLSSSPHNKWIFFLVTMT